MEIEWIFVRGYDLFDLNHSQWKRLHTNPRSARREPVEWCRTQL